MSTLLKLALAAALGLLAVGCKGTDHTDEPPATTPDAGPAPDAGPVPMDTAGSPDDGPPLVPLVDWVSDLVEHHNTATDDPDTVEDKHVAPTEDPSVFDKLIGP